jgi:hypothetical protein
LCTSEINLSEEKVQGRKEGRKVKREGKRRRRKKTGGGRQEEERKLLVKFDVWD